ncbi:MAG: carboxyl transferase domain-containing protein [Sulfuricaulis sp.]|nr:carboxyl transferase domain-containing protein [Sulfuricaulis sp.]
MTTTSKTEELRKRQDIALAGGLGSARERHLAAGKQLVRDRLASLFDDGFDFEDGLLAGTERGLPADAVVTCVGKIHGRDVAVVANDMTVKGGSWGLATLLKITRMQKVALEAGIPIVYLIDSAGARVDDQRDCFLGRRSWPNIFYNLSNSSGVIPQVAAMFGPSPAGAAYIPALCDVVIMVDKQSSMMMGSSRMAKMTIGEDTTDEQLGGARMHCTVSGVGDVLVANETEAIAKVRHYVACMPQNWRERVPEQPARPPRVGAKPINEVVPLEQNVPFDIHDLIHGVVDEGSYFGVKDLFAKEMATGFARLGGMTVGIIANNSRHKGGVLFVDSADKAARFTWMCDAFNIPLLFLMDISGYMIGSSAERAGIIRHGAKFVQAVSASRVSRITVLVRKAYSGGYLAMSGSGTHPDAVLALPTAMPALVGPEAAINAVHYNEIQSLPEAERATFIKEKREEYSRDIDVFRKAADEFHVEAVVDASDLRNELIKRFRVYTRRKYAVIERRAAVHPV